jgi:hypothetical protein
MSTSIRIYNWLHYAAATAAACTKELLTYIDPEVASRLAYPDMLSSHHLCSTAMSDMIYTGCQIMLGSLTLISG